MKEKTHRTWDSDKTRRFRKRLLHWYREHKRELPWRNDPTPYRVWVSEIMLQQTQISTVIPYYERFLARFPDVESLAAAEEAEVLALWAGLGYYSRARNIRKAAREIMTRGGGRFPDLPDEIRRLPGIGRYTAGAILSVAFNQPHPIVDGNVRRVLSRLHGLLETPPDRFLWEQAAAWVPVDHPSSFNQAMMELGALVCRPTNPDCPRCPVQPLCAAHKLEIQERIPAPRVRKPAEDIELVVLVLRHRQAILISSKVPAAFIPGPGALPSAILRMGESPELAARRLLGRITSMPIIPRKAGEVRHGITHRRITAHVFRAESADRSTRVITSGLCWVPFADLDRHFTSSIFRKAVIL